MKKNYDWSSIIFLVTALVVILSIFLDIYVLSNSSIPWWTKAFWFFGG